jgi:hypothetical protein
MLEAIATGFFTRQRWASRASPTTTTGAGPPARPAGKDRRKMAPVRRVREQIQQSIHARNVLCRTVAVRFGGQLVVL